MLFTAKEARCFPETAFGFVCLPSARLSARHEVPAGPWRSRWRLHRHTRTLKRNPAVFRPRATRTDDGARRLVETPRSFRCRRVALDQDKLIRDLVLKLDHTQQASLVILYPDVDAVAWIAHVGCFLASPKRLVGNSGGQNAFLETYIMLNWAKVSHRSFYRYPRRHSGARVAR